MISKNRYEEIGAAIVDAAFHVHRELGPGLLESVYEICMIEEIKDRGLEVQNQVRIPVCYKGKELKKDLGFLINFNVSLIKSGIKRKINGYIL
jgi:hypothetical protein